jgi:hypothetical protein
MGAKDGTTQYICFKISHSSDGMGEWLWPHLRDELTGDKGAGRCCYWHMMVDNKDAAEYSFFFFFFLQRHCGVN